MSTRSSYPYLAISRRFSVNYGLVLAYAEIEERLLAAVHFGALTIDWMHRRALTELSPDVKSAVHESCKSELRHRGWL